METHGIDYNYPEPGQTLEGARLFAAQARAGLLWAPEDDGLFGSQVTSPIPCTLDEADMLDWLLRNRCSLAEQSRINWAPADIDEEGNVSQESQEARSHLSPHPKDSSRYSYFECVPIRYDGPLTPEARNGIATFGKTESAMAAINQAVACKAKEILAWLNSAGSERITLSINVSRISEDAGIPPFLGIVWDPDMNSVREVWSHQLEVSLCRTAKSDERPMGVRVLYARPLADVHFTQNTCADLREFLPWWTLASPSGRLYFESMVDPSCDYEVRLCKRKGSDADKVEFWLCGKGGNQYVLAVNTWGWFIDPVTVREERIVDSEFNAWFNGSGARPSRSAVPEWEAFGNYVERAMTRLQNIASRGLYGDDEELESRRLSEQNSALRFLVGKARPGDCKRSW